jgi:cyclopropane-fatty-acyl-phospholipid synthase
MGAPPVGIVLWNGEEVPVDGRSVVARVVLRDRGSLYKLLSDAEFQFGELYSDGRLDVEGDLIALLEEVNRRQLEGAPSSGSLVGRLRRVPLNTLSRARANAHHHYDIGNAFYRLWLDEAMAYTCAYFPRTGLSLEQAQAAKMEHVCRKLRLKPGDKVVEAGCGWGGLALYMARAHGVTVKAFNVSREQVAFARERAAAEGLDAQVEFIEDDYRNIAGSFDAFVSVGMLEHVGPRHYRGLGGVIDRCLTPSGRGLIHTIGRHRPIPVDAWTATRIFPGAHAPSLKEMMDIFEPSGLVVLDVENLRPHYAATLRHWLERFERTRDQTRAMFDERFVRMWRLYLSASVAAFTTGWLQLYQVAFGRVADDNVPWTREHLYQ